MSLLAISAFLTVLFVPITLSVASANWMDSVGILVSMPLLSIIRASVTAAGFLSINTAQRSGIMRPLPLCAAVFFIEAVSTLGHLVSATSASQPAFRFGFEASASLTFLILLCAAVFAFRGSSHTPKAIWLAVMTAAIVAIVGASHVFAYEDARSAAHRTKTQARTNHSEQQLAAIAAIAPGAPVESLLPFAASEEREVSEAARLRIAKTDRALEQLQAAYSGPHDKTARSIFKEISIERKQTELRAIPKSAGLAAVLRFDKRSEDYPVRELVHARIAEAEDAETQLVKALNGPFAIEAIRALCEVKRQPLDASTYAAAFVMAAKIAARFDSARPPEAEVEALSYALGSLARQGGAAVIEKHRRELMSVYEMGKRAEQRHRYYSHYYVLEKPLGLR